MGTAIGMKTCFCVAVGEGKKAMDVSGTNSTRRSNSCLSALVKKVRAGEETLLTLTNL